jgi:outer membrane protein assembly factor BamB
MQSLLRFLRRNSSKRVFLASVLVLAGTTFQGCTGPRLHSDLKEDTKILVRKWTLQTHGEFEPGDHGTEYSSPILVENTLIFGNRSTGLTAIYPNMNQARWVFPVAGGVVSELTADHGNVFFGGGDGFFYSVNAETGQLNWKYEVRNPVVSKPTVSGARVFLTTSDDVVYALDSGTGKWLWHYRRRSSSSAKIYGASAPLVDANEVLVGLSDGFLVALSVEEGQLKWEKRLHYGAKFTDVNAHPVLENGIVYIPSYDGALYALKRHDGEILWKFDAGGSKDVHLEDQRIFLPSSDGSIYCLSKSGTKVLWKFEMDKGTPTRLTVTDKYIIVGSSYEYLYVLDKESGKGLYRFDVGFGSGFTGAPYFDTALQRLYILSGSGNLYAFEVRKPPRKVRAHGMTDPYDFN